MKLLILDYGVDDRDLLWEVEIYDVEGDTTYYFDHDSPGFLAQGWDGVKFRFMFDDPDTIFAGAGASDDFEITLIGYSVAPVLSSLPPNRDDTKDSPITGFSLASYVDQYDDIVVENAPSGIDASIPTNITGTPDTDETMLTKVTYSTAGGSVVIYFIWRVGAGGPVQGIGGGGGGSAPRHGFVNNFTP